MKKLKFAATVLVMGGGLSGCATVINGTSQDVQIASEPSGAMVNLTGGASCETPCELSLKRKHDLRADFTLPGYKPEYVYVQSRTGGAAAGNILLGGLIGGVVDASNGSTNSLYPRPLNVRLAAEGSSEEAVILGKEGEQISTVAEHNESVREDVEESLMKRGLMSGDTDESIESSEATGSVAENSETEEVIEEPAPSDTVAEGGEAETEQEPMLD